MKLLISVILLYACIGTYFRFDPLSTLYGGVFGIILTFIMKERE